MPLNHRHTRALRLAAAALLTAPLAACVLSPSIAISDANLFEVKRYPIPNSDFPIAQAVEIPAGKSVLYHSGTVPSPANPQAEKGSAAYWGDTEAQTISVLGKIKTSLASMGLTMSDVVKMQAFIVADPSMATGRMDFEGFMRGYKQFFGTAEQPKLPARSTVQVAGLVAPGMLIEIEVTAVRP